MSKSRLEWLFDLQLREAGMEPGESEVCFHPTRRWRFDRAWQSHLLAAELEGGTWSKGRHVRGDGFEKDCEKYNEAALLGWRVLRFTAAMVKDGRALETVKRALTCE